MGMLNSKDTFRLSINLRQVQKSFAADLSGEEIANGRRSLNEQGKSYFRIHTEYGDKIMNWIVKVNNMNGNNPTLNEEQSVMKALQSGDLLCMLATNLFPNVSCQLLDKGGEFSVHKIVFFLELCKTVGIKTSALFTIQDLMLGEIGDPTHRGCVTVLRTIVALEKQARKRGWTGPLLLLKESSVESSLAEENSSVGFTTPTPPLRNMTAPIKSDSPVLILPPRSQDSAAHQMARNMTWNEQHSKPVFTSDSLDSNEIEPIAAESSLRPLAMSAWTLNEEHLQSSIAKRLESHRSIQEFQVGYTLFLF